MPRPVPDTRATKINDTCGIHSLAMLVALLRWFLECEFIELYLLPSPFHWQNSAQAQPISAMKFLLHAKIASYL